MHTPQKTILMLAFLGLLGPQDRCLARDPDPPQDTGSGKQDKPDKGKECNDPDG